ncbi:MAG: hypothetical protein NVV70_15535 [Cellulomonas sp.]|nr:hypothetical protein [Cellulomonas sp.]MCR6649470.1 hypothetical protein [Cellulomonas sp.]
MPLFELDDGRPRLVQPMQPLPGSFAQDLASLLTHHLAAIAGEPLFPVRHRSSAPDHADLPELLALDATGRAVVLEAVQVLDDDAVVAALRHAGAAARMTGTDLARSYHADPDRFAVDFAAFRDQVAYGMATSRREGVRLVVICSEVATEAGDTLSYLRGPGRHVDVLQLGVVRGVDDRRFLDVSPLARHENVRRPVEPTALRLVRSSEASFATAMAYEDGRRRPPAPLGGATPSLPGFGTSHGGTGHGGTRNGGAANGGAANGGSPYGSGLPSTSAFPSGPSQPTTARPPQPGAHRPAAQTTSRTPGLPTTSRENAAVPPPPPQPARPTTAAPTAAVLPVAGTPSAQVSASTRATPAVIPQSGRAAGAPVPPSYAPPTNRTTSSYAPPVNHAPAHPPLTNPHVTGATPGRPPAPYGAPYSAAHAARPPAPVPSPPASRTTSTAPMPAAADPDGERGYPATASPLYESMSSFLSDLAPAPAQLAEPLSHVLGTSHEPFGHPGPRRPAPDAQAYDDRAHDERAYDEQTPDERPLDEPVYEDPAPDPDPPATPAPVVQLPPPPPRRPDMPYPELATLAKQRRALVTLVWFRERRGQRLVATLAPDGSIEFADGARFFEPSEAATYAAGTPVEVDGWRAWRLGDGGPTLAEATGRHDEVRG